MTALHLGPLHPLAQTIVLLVAFGPFVVLVAVVWWVRRRDIAEEVAERSTQDAGSADGGTG